MNLNYKGWIFRNLANIITGIRLGLCFVIAFLGFWHRERMDLVFWWALAAVLTDPLDGIVARRLGITSHFGKSFDRLADKVFEFTIFAIILTDSRVDSWLKFAIYPMVIIEALLLATLFMGVSHKMDVSAGWWGKVKMILVSIAMMASLLMIAVIQNGINVPTFLSTLLICLFVVSTWLGYKSFRGHLKQYVDQADMFIS